MYVCDEGIFYFETSFKLICDNTVDIDDLNILISNFLSLRELTSSPPLRRDKIVNVSKLSLSSSEMSFLA